MVVGKRISFTNNNVITFNRNDPPNQLRDWKLAYPLSFSLPSSYENVKLSNIKIQKKQLSGHILVKNLSFGKLVTVRYTIDNWSTYKETDASFYMKSYNGYDAFVFYWNLDELFPNKRSFHSVKFCIRFIADDSSENWDNNQGCNYELQFIPPTTPKSVALKRHSFDSLTKSSVPIPKQQQRPRRTVSFDQLNTGFWSNRTGLTQAASRKMEFFNHGQSAIDTPSALVSSTFDSPLKQAPASPVSSAIVPPRNQLSDSPTKLNNGSLASGSQSLKGAAVEKLSKADFKPRPIENSENVKPKSLLSEPLKNNTLESNCTGYPEPSNTMASNFSTSPSCPPRYMPMVPFWASPCGTMEYMPLNQYSISPGSSPRMSSAY